MIGHTQLFIWPRYSDIISLLTITLIKGKSGSVIRLLNRTRHE